MYYSPWHQKCLLSTPGLEPLWTCQAYWGPQGRPERRKKYFCLHFYFLPEKQTDLWWSLLNICKWFDVLDENLTWKQSFTALRSMEDGFSICLKPCLKGSTRMSFRCLRDSSMSFFLTPRRIWRREIPFLSANVGKESCFMETTLALSAATYLLIYFALIKINLKFQFCI